VKGFLSRNGVEFDIQLLTDPANRAEVARHGPGEAPLTLVGDEAIFGLDRSCLLSALGRAGLLADTPSDAAGAANQALEPLAPLREALAVACFHADSVAFFHPPTGRYLGPDLERSRVAVPGRPIAVEACSRWNTLAVVAYERGAVTLLCAQDGSYLHGDLESSTFETGDLPLHALAHHDDPLLYVTNSESRTLSVLDPRDGRFAFGSHERSTFALPGQPGVMALQREAGLLHVRLREGAVVMLDARTLKPARGTAEASRFEVGRGRGLALSHDQRILYVPEALGEDDGLALLDARTGRPLLGTPERSRLPTAPTPFAVAAHPSRPIVYVSCFGTEVVELRDGETGEYLNGDAEASSVLVGPGARGILVDASTETAFVTSFDSSTLVAFDAVTGALRSVDGRRSLATGAGPRGMALLGPGSAA
jgi:hypothetical protein